MDGCWLLSFFFCFYPLSAFLHFLCYFNYSLSQWSLQTSPSWMGPSSVCFWYWAHISVVWVPCSPLISWQEDIWMFIIIFLYLEANWISVQFSPSVVSLFAAPWTAAHQVSLSITNSCSFLRPMPIESAMPSNRLILCCPLLLLPSSFPASGSFPVSQLFASGGQSIGALASVLPMNIQDWFPLEMTGLILLSKGLSRVFSNTTVQKHQFFSTQLSLWSNSHIHTWLLEKP